MSWALYSWPSIWYPWGAPLITVTTLVSCTVNPLETRLFFQLCLWANNKETSKQLLALLWGEITDDNWISFTKHHCETKGTVEWTVHYLVIMTMMNDNEYILLPYVHSSYMSHKEAYTVKDPNFKYNAEKKFYMANRTRSHCDIYGL